MSETLRVLVLEDDEQDFRILERHIETLRAPKYNLVRARTAEEARGAMSNFKFDAGLVDHGLSDGASGLDFVKEVGGRQATFPMIMLTGMDAIGFDRQALLVGAFDYLDKLGLTRDLVDRAIRFAIRSHEYEAQLRAAIAAAQEHADVSRSILAVVSQELKSPVSSIRGYSDFLVEEAGDPGIREAAAKLSAAALHLDDFLLNLSEFVRLDSSGGTLQLSAFNLKEMLEETAGFFEHFARHKGIQLDVRIDEATNAVLAGDRLRLRQVLANLIKNAIAYSDGGVITVRATLSNLRLEVRVTDQGVGMPSDKVAALLSGSSGGQNPAREFEGGRGIGLSICRRLLRLMDGELTLESRVGIGTTAGFDVPMRIA